MARYVGGDRLTRAETGAQVGRFVEVWNARGYGQSAVIERATNAFIGRVGLHPWDDWNEVELGWVITTGRQRLGFATEAARAWIDWAQEHRPADHLIAVIQPENAASIATALNLGFQFGRADKTPSSDVSVFRRELSLA